MSLEVVVGGGPWCSCPWGSSKSPLHRKKRGNGKKKIPVKEITALDFFLQI